jgi:hypothetical protein
MENSAKLIGTVVLAFVVIAVVAIIIAYPVMWLVNYLVTPSALIAVFGLPALTFWKAFWLNFLCATLFKSTSVSTK